MPTTATEPQSLEVLALALQTAQDRLAATEPGGWPFGAAARRRRAARADLLAGRTAALEALYARLNPQLEHYLRARQWMFQRSGGVEDLRNQIWLQLLDRIGEFDPVRGSFATWFYTYVVLLVLNRGRRESMRSAERQVPIEGGPEPACESHPGFPAECRQLLERTVAALPARARTVILGLYYCEEPLKQKDLARDLGITPAAVAQTKARALERLRTALADAGCEP